MADTEAQKKVESAPVVAEEKTEKVEETKPVEKEAAAKAEENGEKVENGDKVEKCEKVTEKKSEESTEAVTDKCSIKRKSTGGADATDGEAKKDDSTPEKKAKLDETAPAEAAEANGEVTEAEAAA